VSARRLEVDPIALARARELAERRVSVEELRAALGEPLSEAERAETLSLVRWFCRRYPAPADRLTYVRRAYERWIRAPRIDGQRGPVPDPGRGRLP